jgi:hypothetical protein
MSKKNRMSGVWARSTHTPDIRAVTSKQQKTPGKIRGFFVENSAKLDLSNNVAEDVTNSGADQREDHDYDDSH